MTAAVTQSEAHLLMLARCAVGQVPTVDVLRLLASSVTPPSTLGPTARRLLADTLGRGTVLALARQGGWREGPGGRLWERRPAPALHFSGSMVRLFQWLLRTPLGDPGAAPLALTEPLTLGESVVVTLLLDALRGTGWESVLARQAVVRSSPLVVLAHLGELSRTAPLEPLPHLEVAQLAVAIEGLRGLFKRSWVAAERAKHEVTDPAVLLRMGEAQARVLASYLDAVDVAGQRGLATFLVDAAAEWLDGVTSADDLVRGLSPEAPLRERSAARKAAGALLRALTRLREWDREHRGVRFIDDGYDEAQALVRAWECLGEQRFEQAAAIVRQLDAIPAAEAPTDPVATITA